MESWDSARVSSTKLQNSSDMMLLTLLSWYSSSLSGKLCSDSIILIFLSKCDLSSWFFDASFHCQGILFYHHHPASITTFFAFHLWSSFLVTSYLAIVLLPYQVISSMTPRELSLGCSLDGLVGLRQSCLPCVSSPLM